VSERSLALGFDFGLRRIGVAVGSKTTGTATPLVAVPCLEGQPDWPAIQTLVSEWRPDRLVVGLPYNSDGSESDMSRAARRFGNRLAGRFGLPVEFVDETLSSNEATQRLVGARRRGERRRIRKQDVDRLAASIILQTWLDDTGDRGRHEG
jgi:putative Holliday junction resolvase